MQKNSKSCAHCRVNISTSRKPKTFRCVCCDVQIHGSCAESNDLLTHGYFYCDNHQYMKPANTCRNERPGRQKKINVEFQRILQSAENASKLIQADDSQEKTEIGAEQQELLSQSIVFLNDILQQVKPTSKAANHFESEKDASQMTGQTSTIANENNGISMQHDRVRNYPATVLLPPPFTPHCQKCNLLITSPFFKCYICKASWHDKCIVQKERQNQVLGYWACNNCKLKHDEMEKIIEYVGDRTSMLQEKNDYLINRYANMNLNDPFLNQNHLSQITFQNLIQPGNSKTHQVKPSSEASLERNKFLLEKTIIDQEIAELGRKRDKLNEILQESSKGSCNEKNKNPVAQSTPTNHNVSVHPVRVTENQKFVESQPHVNKDGSQDFNWYREVEKMIESRLKSTLNHSEEDNTSLNRRLVEVQLLESRKNCYRNLPKVAKVGYEWKIFYNAFLNSKDLFTPIENVIRLQQAIESNEIKKLGGINLFTSATYEQALKEIDKRIGKPEKMLITEKQKLISMGKLRNSDTKEIVNFIEEIKSYSALVEEVGSYSEKADDALISRLSRMLPDRLASGWSKEYSQIKEMTNVVLLNDMAAWLDRQIITFETSWLFEQKDPYGEIKFKNSKSFPHAEVRRRSGGRNKESSMLTHNVQQEDDDEYEINLSTVASPPLKQSPANYCWFHNRNGHSSLCCYSLLAKSGQEVCRLANQKGICVICSGKKHSTCPQKEKFTCLIPDCIDNHATIFCFKRKCQKATSVPRRDTNEVSRNPNHGLGSSSDEQRKVKESYSEQGTIRNIPPHSKCHMRTESFTNFNALQLNREESQEGSEDQWSIRETTFNLNCQSNVEKTKNTSSTSSSLVTVVTVKLVHDERSLTCALLLDSGSTTSLLDEKYADLLNLDGPNKPISLSWSGGRSRHDQYSRIVKASACGLHPEAKLYEIYFRTVKDLGMPAQRLNAEEMKSKFDHLENVALTSYSNIVGVIGTDQSWFFKQQRWIETRRSIPDAPTAILTPLGYCLFGTSCPIAKLHKHLLNIESEIKLSLSHSLVKISEFEEEELIKMEERAMGLDYKRPYENDRKIAEEEQAMMILRKAVKYIPDEGRYEAPLLWRDESISLPTLESYKIAVKRLKILMNHVSRFDKLKDVKSQIENLLNKGYVRKLSEVEAAQWSSRTFYIPIFITCPKGKRSRLIMDAAAKIKGKSLNDHLYSGPNLYNNLLNILIQFREGKYFVKADISEMFHQINISKEDCKALRFIFSKDPKGPIEHYEMNRMIFGAVCSPFTSQFITNKIAEENRHKFPEAANAILQSMYVDDLVTSFNDPIYGKRMITDAKKILKIGGFDLVKLKANHPEILKEVHMAQNAEEHLNQNTLSKFEKEKILGYNINYQSDSLSLATNIDTISEDFFKGTKVPTKKNLLKILMSIFDPLGLFTFFTSKLKLVYHWACKAKLDWNEYINKDIIPYWNKIIKWWPNILNLEIPRSYSLAIDEAINFQLIIFGDAGKESVCTVAFIRLLNKENKQLGCHFMASKNHIVPLKQKRTIPELELDAASRCTEFKKILVNAHTIKFNEVIYATDSTCVYTWIKKGASKPTLYIKNRLNKIGSLSSKDEWIWIPTNLQVADYGTKFESLPQFKFKNEWFCPKIFSLPEENWLRLKPPMEEAPMLFNINLQIEPVIRDRSFANESSYFDLFSNWNKLLRMTTLLLNWRWKTKIKRALKLEKMEGYQMTLQELADSQRFRNLWNCQDFQRKYAESLIFRHAQLEAFKKEINHLETGKSLSHSHKLFKHNPFVDEFGLLRITTRLSSVNNYPRDKISPIVLPKKHNITKLIVLYFHESNHHIHYNTIIANIKQRFYIPDISCTAKKMIRQNCYRCKKFNAKPDTPMMGDLPGYRLASHTPPFTYVIVDVCGDFKVTVNRRPQKRWLLVVSCLTTRAIHIEIIHSMDSNSFLMAFQNTINIRGAPKRVISDQGKNFIGGNAILKEMQELWNKRLLEKGMIVEEIEWDFNPAKASHMSGSVERMIGLIKNALRNMHATLNRKFIIPSDEVFKCMICEIIGMLNNRPITMLPLKDSENCFLTPNHFLLLRSNFQSSPSTTSYQKTVLKEWKDVKELINILWKHFNKAYITEIMHREKWIDFKKPLSIGDIVVMADPTVNNLWRLGVIVKVIEGSKNQTRKVTVRLGKRGSIDLKMLKDKKTTRLNYMNESYREVTRPVSELAPLNLTALAHQ